MRDSNPPSAGRSPLILIGDHAHHVNSAESDARRPGTAHRRHHLGYDGSVVEGGFFDRLSVWDLLALRFSLAAIAMLMFFVPAIGRLPITTLLKSAALGAAYGRAQILANVGLERTPAGIASPVLTWR